MQASIDFGNTIGKIGFFRGNEMIESLKLKAEEIITLLKEKNPKRIIVCSVAHTKSELESIFNDFKNIIFFDQNTKIPITNFYETKNTLGYDRLAGVIGANFFFPNNNSLVIDIGTAIKYDFINQKKEYIGGMIGAGLNMRFKALHTFTKKLPLVEATEIPELIGKNTQDCIKSGVVNGMIAEINGIIKDFNKFENLQVILTGGDASFFEKQIKSPYFAAPNLVLQGLNCINIYNE